MQSAQSAQSAQSPWAPLALAIAVVPVALGVVCAHEIRDRQAAERGCQRAQQSQLGHFESAVAATSPAGSMVQEHVGCSTGSDPHLAVTYPEGISIAQARAGFAEHGWTRTLPGIDGTRMSPTGDLYANFATRPGSLGAVVVYVQQVDFVQADD